MHEHDLLELAKELKPTFDWQHEARIDLPLGVGHVRLEQYSESERLEKEQDLREIFYNSPWRWDRRIETDRKLFDETIRQLLSYKNVDESCSLTTVRVYVDAKEPGAFAELVKALDKILLNSGLDVEAVGPPLKGSWYQTAIAVFKSSAKPFKKIKSVLEHVLQIEAKNTNSHTEDIVSLMAALKKTKQAAIQVGPILLVKSSPDGDEQIIVKELTRTEQEILIKNSFLLQHPQRLIEVLENGSDENIKKLG